MKQREIHDNISRLKVESDGILHTANDAKRALSTEEDERFMAIHKEIARLFQLGDKLKIQQETESRELELEAHRKVETERLRKEYIDPELRKDREKRTFDKYLRFGLNGMDHDEIQTMRGRFNAGESRAQSVGTDSEGGYTVPEGFQAEVASTMLAFGGMRAVSRILQTSTGNDLPWPGNDDTGNTGAILAENDPVTEQDLTFTSITLNAYKYTSKLVKVSNELLTDSAFNMGSFLAEKLGERIGRATNAHFTTGTGSSQPKGSTVAATASSVALDLSETISMDNLISVLHSLDPAYRTNASWMMHDDMLALIRKLSILTGSTVTPEFAWQAGLTPDAPPTILGKPYTINQQMPQPTDGNTSLLFGDFSKYIIRDVAGMRILRLEELYAANDQVGFVAFSRHDGDLTDATAIVSADTQT